MAQRRLQVILSACVIAVCASYLFFHSLPNRSASAPVHKSELSECHFLLKHSYVDEPDGRSLILASASRLSAYLPDQERVEERWRARFEGVSEEVALQRLESLVQEVSADPDSGLDYQTALYVALDGMVTSLDDPFTLAMDPQAYAKFQRTLHSQPFGGVGLQLGRQEDRVLVFAVLPNTPAARAGIAAGDILFSVEEREVGSLAVEEVEALLNGEPGTDVFCRFIRNGAKFSRTLARVPLNTRSVRGRIVDIPDGPRVGWLSVDAFTESTGRELIEELERLKPEDTDGLLLDLRDNVGGYVNAALEMASVFLESGSPVVVIESREEADVKATLGEAVVEARPMIVLVNRRTASSAEILAACLQDYQRAKIVGEKTFGKGSVQSLHEFESGGGLKYTTARYTSPKGRRIDGNGLLPDQVLEEVDILTYCKERWKRKR